MEDPGLVDTHAAGERERPFRGRDLWLKSDASGPGRHDGQRRCFRLAGLDEMMMCRQENEHGETGCPREQVTPSTKRHAASVGEMWMLRFYASFTRPLLTVWCELIT